MMMRNSKWFAGAIALVATIGCGSDTPPDDSAQQLPDSAISQIESLLAEKAARTPAQKKIASALLYMKSNRFAAALADTKDPAKKITSLAQTDSRGRVLVDIRGDVGVARSKVDALGGTVVGSSSPHSTTRAWMPLEKLEDLASDGAIANVRTAFAASTQRHDPPSNPRFRAGTREERVAAMQAAREAWHPENSSFAPTTSNLVTATGAATSEGVRAHGVEHARRFFGADGTGATVGVLSDSDDHKEQSIATGDLPADTITIEGQDGRPGTGEGTAMMEIVHDMAPGAKLVFATAFNGPDVMADNIRRMRFEFHCDVIVDDVIYFAESPYQDDIIAQAVDDVVADGAMYFSSAGNAGNFDDGTSGTWEGDFKSLGTLATLPSGYTVHDFGSKVVSNRIEATGGPIYLQWSDPSTLENPQSINDYDLFILDNDLRNVVVASTDIQDGSNIPFEFLGFSIPAGFRVVVAAHPTAAPRAIRVSISNGQLGIATAGATYGHNSANGALGVAAVDVAEAGGGEFTKGATTPVELFSSDGPRRIFWNRDGNAIDPDHPGATFASKGGQLRNKPDIAGADGVSTTLDPFSGLNPFFGTSAAAPHAGAIAALAKAAVPGATSDQILDKLRTSALDIEGPLTDRDSGKGIAQAFTLLSRLGAPKAVFLELFQTAVVGTVLPGGGGQIQVTLVNNGGAKATAVNATLSSSSPHVTMTQATSSYPSIPAAGTGTDALPFAFTVDASTPCGAQLPFSLSVDYTGNGQHPTVVGFVVQVGKPGAPTHVAYTGVPVAIPDGDTTVGADATIALPDVGPISKLVFHLDGSACSADEGSTTVGLDHTWVGDLTLTLRSPDGTAVKLFDRPGGVNNSGNNFCQTVLDDAGASSIQTIAVADAPWTGTFQPAQPLAGFAGVASAGTWTVHATDAVLSDVGSIRAFSIDVSGFTCTP